MEMGDRVEFTTPKGRLIFGDPWVMERLDYEGNVKTVKSGANAGQERPEFVLGLAILKTNPDVEAFRTAIHTTGQRDYPDLFDGNLGVKPGVAFALKYVDGDSAIPNAAGNKPCEKPNYPGCYVFTFKTARPLKRVTTSGLAEILDSEQLRTGDWVRIAGKMVGNGQTGHTAGLYLNPETVEFQHRGDPITGATDPKKAFAAPATGGVPQGAAAASAAPAAPAPTTVGAAPPPHNAILDPHAALTARLTPKAAAANITKWQDLLDVDPNWTEDLAVQEKYLNPA